MELYVWTDGALRGKDGIATSILLTDEDFVGVVNRPYNVRNPFEIEMLGIIQAFEHLADKDYSFSSIKVYTDAKPISDKFNEIKGLGNIPKNLRYKKLWGKLLRLTRNKNVSIEYVAGHQEGHNPNKLCDILGKMSYRCGTDT